MLIVDYRGLLLFVRRVVELGIGGDDGGKDAD